MDEVKVSGTEFKDVTKVNEPAIPEGIPEKFWDKETKQVNVLELAKSYKELSTKLGNPAEIKEAKPLEVGPHIEATKETSQVGSFTDEELGKWAGEFQTNNGELTEDTYKDLGKRGFNRMLVDGYLAGQMALAEKRQIEDHKLAGGSAETMQGMLSWASENLSKPEQEAFNATMMKPNAAARGNAISGLWARYKNADGSPASRKISGHPAAGSDAGFRDTSEMIAAINDPRYKTSPAYVAEVEAKIAAMQK